MLVYDKGRYHTVISKNTGKLYFPLSGDRHESKKYLDFVNFIFKRDEGKCQRCGATHNLRSHHLIPYRERPDLGLDPNNVVLLCEHCEGVDHERYNKQRLGYNKRVKSY